LPQAQVSYLTNGIKAFSISLISAVIPVQAWSLRETLGTAAATGFYRPDFQSFAEPTVSKN